MHRTPLMVLAVALLTLPLALACGDDDDGDAQPTAAATEPAGATQPADDQIDISGIPELEDGVLGFGSDIAYPPIEFLNDENEPDGLDVDIGNALGEVLGVRTEFTNGVFDGLITALQASRHDALMSAMWINEERLAEVDMIPYVNVGGGIIVPEGNPDGVQEVADLCGLTVATQEGTVHVDFLTQQSEACVDAGEEAITINRFSTDPEAVLALLAGQADAEMADFPVAALSSTEREGEIDLVDTQIDPIPYGIALRKESTALRDALEAAFIVLVRDGTYDEILEKWGMEAGAIE
jgi:polar amino acid transport system substrate-binding protein